MENENNEMIHRRAVRREILPPETKSYEDIVGTEFDNAEERLIQFVSRQIDKMNENLLFDGKKEPSLYELNISLVNYQRILLALTSLYNETKFDVSKKEEEYDAWYAEKFIETRNRLNPRNEPQSKWFTAKEIEFVVKSENKEKHAKFRARIAEAECKRSLVERLIKGWENYQFILGQLSKNSIAEADAEFRISKTNIE